MDLGLHYLNFSTPGDPQWIADTFAAAAKTAEKAGFAGRVRRGNRLPHKERQGFLAPCR